MVRFTIPSVLSTRFSFRTTTTKKNRRQQPQCKMDLLKKELELKKKALLEAKKAKQEQFNREKTTTAVTSSDNETNHNNNGTKVNTTDHIVERRYMKASQLREILDEQEELEREKRRRKRMRDDNNVDRFTSNDDALRSNNNNEERSRQDDKLKSLTDKESEKTQHVDTNHTSTGLLKNNKDVDGIVDELDRTPPELKAIPVIAMVEATTAEERKQRQEEEQHITKQLRIIFGLPIRYFGETNEERRKRYQIAIQDQEQTIEHLYEKDEYRLGLGHAIRNPFLEKDEEDVGFTDHTTNETNDVTGNEKKKKKVTISSSTTETAATTTTLNEEVDLDHKHESKNNGTEDTTVDPHKRVYRYFKGLLKEWEDDLVRRPEDVKRSVAGKNETKTVKQCKDYIRPLFKLCKHRMVDPNMIQQLDKMVTYCEQGEFVLANDSYMDIAIGRAAWPIGVTMVGIHARSGRAKIESGKVAHVMNDELTRKYLTSVKRLITYNQKKRSDVNPSKKVQN